MLAVLPYARGRRFDSRSKHANLTDTLDNRLKHSNNKLTTNFMARMDIISNHFGILILKLLFALHNHHFYTFCLSINFYQKYNFAVYSALVFPPLSLKPRPENGLYIKQGSKFYILVQLIKFRRVPDRCQIKKYLEEHTM
jgi:hypothetical protein